MKIASNPDQLIQLNQEQEIFEIIKTRDLHGESIQFLVNCLNSSQILCHNNNNNNSNNESIYFLSEGGEIIPSPFPLHGLVFEFGEINLHQYLKDNYSRLAVIHKINILEDIVKAVTFLHKLGIVHFDLKPENIVCFSSIYNMKWKLIDFDSSFDLNTTPKPSIIYPVNNIRLTEEYVSPEVMRVIKNTNNNNNNNNSNIRVEINDKMDIWSVGMIGVILFSNQSLWKLLRPETQFNSSMVSNIKQEEVENILTRQYGEKIKSFIGDCLKVEGSNRKNGDELLGKSLFRTDSSTIHSNTLHLTRETINQSFIELRNILEEYQVEGQGFISSELNSKLSELLTCL